MLVHGDFSPKNILRGPDGPVILDAERERWIFAGDSPNDAPLFAYFPHSVGVANVRSFSDRIATLPRYVTVGEAGAGFAELARALLD